MSPDPCLPLPTGEEVGQAGEAESEAVMEAAALAARPEVSGPQPHRLAVVAGLESMDATRLRRFRLGVGRRTAVNRWRPTSTMPFVVRST